jgi:peptidyl-prolyl cis-trans isomerase SurA
LIKPNAILSLKAALKKIKKLRKRILKGTSFKSIAIEFSDDKSNSSQGGDMKWVNPGKFVPEFEKVMNQLPLKKLSRPVKTTFGYHLIEVLARRKQDQTNEKKRERAHQLLFKRKFDEEVQNWINELKEKTHIQMLTL